MAVSGWWLAVARDWGLGIGEPENANLKPNKEPYPLVLPPLPAASPPKGGDKTLAVKTKSVSVPPLGGERWCEAPKGAC